jgi:phage terminase large subunit-like protein
MKEEILADLMTWRDLARPEQLAPGGDWRTWLILAGRGFGKTRTGAETICQWVNDGTAHRIYIAAQTTADARDLSVEALRTRIIGFNDEGKPKLGLRRGLTYEPSKRRVQWANGASGITFSAEDPDSFRGYQGDTAWLDEVAAWRYPESYDQLQYGLRIGWARQIVTTTPRPVRVIRELLADPTTSVTRGRTLDNAANLSATALAYLLARYEGTRLGRQELDAELLEDIPGALWSRAMIVHKRPPMIERHGIAELDMTRIVVAIDPAVTNTDDSDETGIVVDGIGVDGRGYTLADLSGRMGPMDWARRAVRAYHDYKADVIVAEANNGGDLVSTVLAQVDPNVPVVLVHASRGKRTRAEPVAALYEQGKWFHAQPFPDLEDQQCSYTGELGDSSPDRMDAHVWGVTELMRIGESQWGNGSWGGTFAAATA